MNFYEQDNRRKQEHFEKLLAEERVITVHDVIFAECNLEPITCLFCNSQEVTFNQYIGDAYCADCGEWQLEESVE